jgi:predicted cupin superfamily sugar epimerase
MEMNEMQVSSLVARFKLLPHPEGGYYSETYRSGQNVQSLVSGNERSASTAIYYLLDKQAFSAWHRIASDEVWHFYAGGPLLVHVLLEGGKMRTHRLGNALEASANVFQAVVPAGCWFAAELAEPGTFAFVGCTVAPGFEFSEFELARAVDLQPWLASGKELIGRLLKPAC